MKGTKTGDLKTQDARLKRERGGREHSSFASFLVSCLPGIALRAAVVVWMSCLSAFAAPTVDFYENDGVATQISATTFRLDMTVKNNMDTEPSPNPYGDYVSAFKIDGIYSSETPSVSDMPASWATGTFG